MKEDAPRVIKIPAKPRKGVPPPALPALRERGGGQMVFTD